MTNTYSGDPNASVQDQVRFLLGDTAEPWKFTDEEINYVLTKFGGPYSAAEELSLIRAAHYTEKANKSVGPLRIDYKDIADRWRALAKEMRGRAGRTGGARAITTQKSTEPYYRLGMHDNSVSKYPDLNGDVTG
jgi:hypothetical protein